MMTEVALFRPNDEPCLVAASLSCPGCLSGAVDWSLSADGLEAHAHCHCRHCGHERTVELSGFQELRLRIDRERVEQASV